MEQPKYPVLGNESKQGTPIKIKTIDTCDFPIIESTVGEYKVLVLPPSLRGLFDEEGYHAVRINSTEITKSLPEYGGKTASMHSLLPHQDHLPTNKRRFLALSQENLAERGSSTYMISPEIMQKILPDITAYFETNRDTLQQFFIYDPASQVSENDLRECFEPGGLDRIVEKNIGSDTDKEIKLFAYSGILAYLIQGARADAFVEELLKKYSRDILSEEWKTPGTLIIDNARVFHGRLGPNKPLKRNWLVEGK